MKITTEYILEVVGKKKYHSCIMASFSFDFYFFEMNIMRSLRAAGISNISVLIDANILQDNLGNLTGNEHRISRTYSLTSINSKGVFHPKMYLFFGENEGLLIVGSGNLTSSGHGKNDEIWGAFHFSNENILNLQIISNAWDYFQQITLNTKGYTTEKIKWIKEFTPWLSKLPSPNQAVFQKLDENNEIAFITNDNSSNIFEKTKQLISYEDIYEITIVSPFFDRAGKALTAIYETFPDAKINTILDDENGSIPYDIDNEISEKISFYNWIDCYKLEKFEEKNRKLHAKLIVFKSKKQQEFCLFGSANISVAGLGTDKRKAINEEVSLLLKRRESNLLSDLNISIKPLNAKGLSSFQKKHNSLNENNIFHKINYSVKLHAIDKEPEKLTIYIDEKISENKVVLGIYDTYGELIKTINIKRNKDGFIAKLNSRIDNALYGQLIDKETNNPISEKQIIQDIYILAKTNPNPKNQILDILFNNIEAGDDTLIPDLLKYINMDDFSSESTQKKINIQSHQKTTEEANNENPKDEFLSYDKFTHISNENRDHHLKLLNNTPNKMAEFFSLFFKLNTKEDADFQEMDSEETDSVDESSGREDIIKKKVVQKSEFQRRKKYVTSFLSRYNKYLENKVSNLLKNSNNNIDENHLTLTDLSNYLIALHLTIYYTGREFTYIDETKNKNGITEENEKNDFYLYVSGDFNKIDNLKGITNEIIGKFLLLSTRGFVKYENNYTITRLERAKKEALYFSFYAIFNSTWERKEFMSKILLYLNSAFYLSDDFQELNDFQAIYSRIIELTKKADNSKKEQNEKFVRKDFFGDFKNVFDNYFDRLNGFKTDYKLSAEKRKSLCSSFNITENDIIFTSRYGFCNVKNKYKDTETVMFDLFRPGFLWNEIKENYILEKDKKFKKNLVLR